ncbi:putative porin [Mucilaginibacter mali]|uniref:Putative porin n=1 Tax=Mucilaginibacter mali TaxID=2740462 RepID=A0A7D4Q599_9SPHI|nr:putative porin [Mucilaginibacter mali]QKJ31607.1 putative porin [Mucilaginibacter mali]
MFKKIKYLLLLMVCFFVKPAFAQFTNPNQTQQQQQSSMFPDTTTRRQVKPMTEAEMMDSLRKKEENKHDSVVFSAKFIRITNERLLSDSTQVLQLDTGIVNFENYSPLYQPKHPTIGLGSLGLASRPLLFEPQKKVGFDVGLHYLDAYMMYPQDMTYYRARVPYSNLQLYTAGRKEQVFKAVVSENINPQLNIGAKFDIIGSTGYYNRQNVSELNAAIFSWYESKGKRYNLLTNIFFNNLKAPESGGILNDSVFTKGSFDKTTEAVRLPNAKARITNNGFYLKQFYYIGHIDSAARGNELANIQPTQRVMHTFMYNKQTYGYFQSGADTYKVFPDYYFNSVLSNDSLYVQDIHNEFSYSFYLRPKSVSFVKNELKLDLGLIHDLYNYKQYVSDSVLTVFGKLSQETQKQAATFQNITLRAKLGYKFSNRVLLDADFHQVAQGRNFGDYLYDVKFTLAGNNKTGRIILGAYAQNNAPPLVASSWISNHYIFHPDLKNQKTENVSFNYINDALQLDLKAEYFMINDYIYFGAQPGGIDATPQQITAPINLLKLSVEKKLTWRRIHFDNYLVYQKTDYQSTLRTPEVYLYSNLYYGKRLFDAIDMVGGLSVRYNTPYVAPSYAIGIGQFYNGANVTYNSYPYASVYLKATLQRTNLFIQYDYANQGLQSNGFYTVVRYPMQDRALKLGVSWTFYN